jgi:hypothetical protein
LGKPAAASANRVETGVLPLARQVLFLPAGAGTNLEVAMLSQAAGIAATVAIRAALVVTVLVVVLSPRAAMSMAVEKARRLRRHRAGPRR